MPWQEWIFIIGQLIFVIALIPTIKGKDKPAFITSFVTTIFIFLFGIAYLTLNLWGSAIFAFLNSAAWGVLATQKYFIDKKS